MRRLIPVIKNTRHQADEPHGHGRRGDPEADVHAGVSLDPNEDSEGDELADGEGEVGGVEVGGEPLALPGAVRAELVRTVRDHVRLHAATPQRHQVERQEEYQGLEAFRFLANNLAACRGGVAFRGL